MDHRPRESPANVMSEIAELKAAPARRPIAEFLPGWQKLGWLVLALILLGMPARSFGQVTVLVSTNYYTVTGSSVPEIWESMMRSGPWNTNFQYSARTDWETRYTYATRVTSRGQWTFRSIAVLTKVTVYLPRWTPPPGTDPALADMWAQFRKGMGLHELGHISVARTAAADLYRQLYAVPAKDSREALKAAVDSTAARVLDTYQKVDDTYDRETRHGVTQGAVFPGRRGPAFWQARWP
jgi:predicted secreted Zn-dependent protease